LTGSAQNTDAWRYKLSEFTTSLIERCDGNLPGGEIAAEYVWALLNPQLESAKVAGERDSYSRLIEGIDGIPELPMRDQVFSVACERFANYMHIVSHYGKFLSEKEQKFVEADKYLLQAYDLEPENEAVQHMLGKRYFDEVRCLLYQNPARTRSPEIQDRIDELAKKAHEWFDKAREASVGSEYNYTTPIQLIIILIEDEFRRKGIKIGFHSPEILLQERIADLLSHADNLVAQGLRYIPPQIDHRAAFVRARDSLHRLRGDVDTAITCFRNHLDRLHGSENAAARVQLARLLVDRAERNWHARKYDVAANDFNSAERHLFKVLEDPARRFDNIQLWFNAARHLTRWNRQNFLTNLHQLHEHHSSLDSSFLIMCLYFADAVQTGSIASWRKYEEFQIESARRSANLAIRSYIREWLVQLKLSTGTEWRIYPNYIFASKDDEGELGTVLRGEEDPRVILDGTVLDVVSSTVAYLAIKGTNFKVFFKPRVLNRLFFKSDERRTKVSFAVAFTYDKPIAYDVQRLPERS
jgi:tetratricopeptide (TPR) repeat protein